MPLRAEFAIIASVNIDMLIDGILDSYERYGMVNGADDGGLSDGTRLGDGNGLGGDTRLLSSFPDRQVCVRILGIIENLIFPGFKVAAEEEGALPVTNAALRYVTGTKVNQVIAMLTAEVQKALIYTARGECCPQGTRNIEKSHCFNLAQAVSFALIEEIPLIRNMVIMDAKALLDGDPAAGSAEEVILSYPGLEAILSYRIAHFLASNGVPVIPRIMSEHTHGKTGIDINPKAVIGERFFIDHGTGVVIGETCVIGRSVKIYQGVTLGALSVKKEMTGKRHPTIEDDVTIYAGATILGGDTVIGRGSIIGGNTWITKSVAPGSVITR